MKYLPTILYFSLQNRASRRNLKSLRRFLAALSALTVFYSVVFHFLMAWEGRQHSWITGLYWTLTVMSTLGFGDITFHSDVGRAFSIIVLLSGTIFMLILLPFTFIQFFYAPWIEAQQAALAPRELPEKIAGHVVLTRYGPVEAALIRRLVQYGYLYVIVVADLAEALRLRDLDLEVALGELDDLQTYKNIRLEQAALLAATHSDISNTNIVFTAREAAPRVPIVATCTDHDSIDNLEMAGCDRVLQLSEMLGKAMARRVTGGDAKAHVVGDFDGLLIAEASAAGTPLVDRTLREIGLRQHANINVVGTWERGRFTIAGPDTLISATTILVLAGTRKQLDDYDALFCIYRESDEPVVVLGGGRVGRAVAQGLADQEFDYRVVEKVPGRVADSERLVHGDAADIEILQQAGLMKTPAVVVTTHDDDMNVYLTLYCRRLRPDVQIISRATVERNISTLYRAGADFVLSYASMGANEIFNSLERTDLFLVAEGLDVFTMEVPRSLSGKTLQQADIRTTTGCSVIAIEGDGGLEVNPPPDAKLSIRAKLVLIGGADSQDRFIRQFVRR
ncbi:MAG: NAD-binding protein [Planctomycetota bacterium]|nr:NAD-binding protein [Planctomycetota bacterium]